MYVSYFLGGSLTLACMSILPFKVCLAVCLVPAHYYRWRSYFGSISIEESVGGRWLFSKSGVFRSVTGPFLLVQRTKLEIPTSAIDPWVWISSPHFGIEIHAKYTFGSGDLKVKMCGFDDIQEEVQGALNRLFIEFQKTHLLTLLEPPQTQRLWRSNLLPHQLVISQQWELRTKK